MGGVVRKRKLPPPAASTVYELTEYGQELEEPLYALARWGARSLPPPTPNEDFYPDWGLNAFAALLDPEAARGITATYVVRVADDVYTVQLDDGKVHVETGASGRGRSRLRNRPGDVLRPCLRRARSPGRARRRASVDRDREAGGPGSLLLGLQLRAHGADRRLAVRLETERLVLRPLTLDDLDDIAALRRRSRDDALHRHGRRANSGAARESLEWMIETFERHGFGHFGVERKEDGALVGRCGPARLGSVRLVDHEAGRGRRARSRSRSPTCSAGTTGARGYATEAASAVRDWALGELGFERLIALIYPGQRRSIGSHGSSAWSRGRGVELGGHAADALRAAGSGPAR